MKLFLDCEFTQLKAGTKLISLALVSEAGEEFYVELTDTSYQIEDCSEFVIANVLPQLDIVSHGKSLADAQAAFKVFIAGLDGPLEICSDALAWDWELFCLLAYTNHKWPAQIINRPTNLIQVFRDLDAADIDDLDMPELPHHALQDARILATLYAKLSSSSNEAALLHAVGNLK